ncbi:hypothetical protein HEP75_02537 [Xanthomonas sp. SI]|nr:hypothetical protein HEP75_02537 [Xanthomonas sp. SI]
MQGSGHVSFREFSVFYGAMLSAFQGRRETISENLCK